MQTPTIPLEDRPQVIGTVLSSALLLATVAQHIWENPLLNIMAVLAPVLYLVATVAMRCTPEDAYDDEAHDHQDGVRYTIVVLAAAYLSTFTVLAVPREWSWVAVIMLVTPALFILICIADRWARKRNERPERDLLDEPFQLEEAAIDAFVERGATNSHYARLIEPQFPR